MKVIKDNFGKTNDGRLVNSYKMMASDGSFVTVLSYGLIIQSIEMPDKDGNLENIVLGFNDISTYEKAVSYYGAIIGRYSGRLANGSFQIDGKTYNTTKQNSKVTLHGGEVGFDKKIFDCNYRVEDDKAVLECEYVSADLEEGFPGELKLKVIFTFDEDKNLNIRYLATSSKDTIVNITSHSYFNLTGNYGKIYDEKLYVNAEEIMTFDDNQAPNGFEPIFDAVDFRQMKKIGADMLSGALDKTKGIDHIFKLKKEKDVEVVLQDDKSGRKIEVETTGECVVVYSQNYLDKIEWVYDEIPIQNHSAVCLETQYFPNAINIKGYEKVLRKGELYDESTTYKFGLLNDER